MPYMFSDAVAFNQDLLLWNASSITDRSHVFSGAADLIKVYANGENGYGEVVICQKCF
jgi:Mycoplasma protein of unknown function, DUF285